MQINKTLTEQILTELNRHFQTPASVSKEGVEIQKRIYEMVCLGSNGIFQLRYEIPSHLNPNELKDRIRYNLESVPYRDKQISPLGQFFLYSAFASKDKSFLNAKEGIKSVVKNCLNANGEFVAQSFPKEVAEAIKLAFEDDKFMNVWVCTTPDYFNTHCMLNIQRDEYAENAALLDAALKKWGQRHFLQL